MTLIPSPEDRLKQMGAVELPVNRQQKKPVPRPDMISARALMARAFPPVKYIVPGYLCEGATILAGAPKLGKSWFVYEVALAVSSGGTCLGGIQCEQGEVLYLALEDNLRRLQNRLKKLWQAQALLGVDVPEGISFATEWPRMNDGGIEALEAWLSEHPAARLIVIDVLAQFRPIARSRDQSLYDGDYHAIKALQELSGRTGIAIVIVHHTRKSPAEIDPFETVSGSMGLSGAADSVLILRRDSQGVTLYGRGREIEEIETAVTFNRETCRWVAQGAADEVRQSDERSHLRSQLEAADTPLSPSDIAALTGMKNSNVRRLLINMVKDGQIKKAGYGKYAHINCDLGDTPDTDHTDHTDHSEGGDDDE